MSFDFAVLFLHNLPNIDSNVCSHYLYDIFWRWSVWPCKLPASHSWGWRAETATHKTIECIRNMHFVHKIPLIVGTEIFSARSWVKMIICATLNSLCIQNRSAQMDSMIFRWKDALHPPTHTHVHESTCMCLWIASWVSWDLENSVTGSFI